MRINREELEAGLWFTDENLKRVPWDGLVRRPKGAVYAHTCFPLEVRHQIYKIRPEGGYGDKDKVFSWCTNLSRSTGRLAVEMVNSGDYDLYEALAILAQCCERCCNVLWDKYLPGEDGYPEYSEEWQKANTCCQFCEGE